MNLQNKVIVITGASSGIGEALAVRLAKKGANLVLVARRKDKLEKLVENLKQLQEESQPSSTSSTPLILPFVADVTKRSNVINLFSSIHEEFKGKIDILINNAGKGLPKKLLDITESEWDSLHAVNSKGVFLCTQEAVKLMQNRNSNEQKITSKQKGHIITISSIVGLIGAPGYSAYASSKHAATGFLKSIKLELWRKGVKVSTIHPGRIDTEFFNIYDKRPSSKQMLSSDDLARYIVAVASRSFVKARIFKSYNLLKRGYNLLS